MSAPSPGETLLPRFSLERRITVLVLLASAAVVGAVAAARIPVELFPRGFEIPHLAVQVPWRDAPPEEVLEKIVLPLEEELAGVRGVGEVFSIATTGSGRVFLNFKPGTDMDVAYREVRDRMERARARLPRDADRLFLRKEDETGIPVAVLGLAVDPELADAYDLIQKEVLLPLQRIDGVAAVRTDGLEPKEITIELDRDRAEAAGLSIYQLGAELAGDNFTLASGTVRSGGDKLLLRSVARYGDLAALEARPLQGRMGPTLRLKDVARVRYQEAEKNYRARALSRPAVAVIVLKEGEANTLAVSREIGRVLERLRRNPRLARIEMLSLFDQGEVILESLNGLVSSGVQGAWIAIAVLFFFLGRVRMTLIVTLAIPLSLLLALIAMYFAGESLNILSLLGLMISVGMLVDNSVVVAENVDRLHRAGVPRREAAVRGAGEIALAITLATLTTVAVFLPVSLVEGQGQFFLLRLSIPISVALLGSLLVALVCVPLAVYLTLPRDGGAGTRAAHPRRARLDALLSRAYGATFGLLERSYGRLLGFFLGRRLDLVLGLAAVLALTAAVSHERVEVQPTQEEEQGGFEIDVELPEATTLPEAEQYFLSAEKVVAGLQEELDLEGYFLFHRATRGEIQGWFRRPRTRQVTPREATERVLALLPEKPGAEIFTGDQGNDQEDDAGIYALTLFGEDAAALEELARGLEELFATVPGVLGVKRAAERAPSELALVLDRGRAQRQGVDPEAVAGVVGYALRGQALPRYYQDGREIPVRVRFEEPDRTGLAELSGFQVPSTQGELVRLSGLTEVRLLPASQRIERRNRRVARPVTLELAQGREEEARERLAALAAGLDLPEGVSLGLPDQEGETGLDEDLEGMVLAGLLSIVFIYLLMGFLFESFLLPLSILLTIPLAAIGVVWAHALTGLDLDVLGVVGAVLLIGVVVNNGIVLIDAVNRLRGEGLARREALLLATERRFRPIMMTALTTICGMIPLALGGSTSIGLSYRSFGLTLIGGMTTATLLTLLVVPIFYTFFDDAREAVGRTLAPPLPPALTPTRERGTRRLLT